MGLFGKKKTNDYEQASADLNNHTLARDRLIMEKMPDDDTLAAKYADEMKGGNPLILNFDGLDELAANKMLAFFTGVAYALDGKTVKINETTFLFARRVDFLDGSLTKFIQELPRG